jgi:hypothetical protein
MELLIDPKRSLAWIQERINEEQNVLHKGYLENFRDHMIYEGLGDFEGLMSLIIPRPEYHFYGRTDHFGLEHTTDFYGDDVKEFYGRTFNIPGNTVGELEVHKLAVEDWGIFMDTTACFAVRGRDVPPSAGLTDVNPEGFYRTTYRVAILCPYEKETGLLVGETVYMSKCLGAVAVPEGQWEYILEPAKGLGEWMRLYVKGAPRSSQRRKVA